MPCVERKMFEGADLSSVYGNSSDFMPPSPPVVQVQQPQQMLPPPSMSQQQQPKQMVSVQQPGEIPYNPPVAMYAHENKPVVGMPTESFWDRVSQKRYEVLKIVVLALIVLLALSMDSVFKHYLTQYISDSLLTTMQELLVRVSYPVAVLLAIWFIKSM